MDETLKALRDKLTAYADLQSAAALLSWDQSTHMPAGGAEARARQIALLEQLAHERLTDPKTEGLLDALERETASLPADSFPASFVRVARKDFERGRRLPARFVSTLASHAAETYVAWTRARPANDFAAMRPCLERTLELSLEHAAFFPECAHPADSLIDNADPGMTVEKLRPFFLSLRGELVPIVRALAQEPLPDDSFLHRPFPEREQLAFGARIAERFGYDFARGRQDKTHHPFMVRISGGDVRITTRVRETDLAEALFSTLHETGHALYEQNIDPEFDATPLGQGASSGVHESQSRLWENLVARSRPFWRAVYPELRRTFGAELDDVSEDSFYRAINRVEPSLIRTNADEVTYNLHVALRFDFELALLEGKLKIADLPEAWRERMRSDLGVVPQTDADGVLQDVHWYSGLLGGCFQSYTLGNVMSAQFFEAALEADPEIPAEIERGSFNRLRRWLAREVYRSGRSFLPEETLERATGQKLSTAPYFRYLRRKYGELYPGAGLL